MNHPPRPRPEPGTPFARRLEAVVRASGSAVCVGLDPRPERLREPVLDACRRLIDACAPYAAAIEQIAGTRPCGRSSVIASPGDTVQECGTCKSFTTTSWLPVPRRPPTCQVSTIS